MLSLIEQLSSGQSIQISVTIPEGKNLFQIANIVESKKICPAKEFINLAKNPSFVKQLNLPGERVEGYLYPDTYRFSEGLPCKDVISKMVETLTSKLKTLILVLLVSLKRILSFLHQSLRKKLARHMNDQ